MIKADLSVMLKSSRLELHLWQRSLSKFLLGSSHRIIKRNKTLKKIGIAIIIKNFMTKQKTEDFNFKYIDPKDNNEWDIINRARLYTNEPFVALKV